MPRRIDWLGRTRLASGVVLYAYVASHLANHALGLVSLEAMEWGRLGFLAVWRNPLGTLLLYRALASHVALVLYSLYRRRSLRMRRAEIAQVVLGLAVPPLLAMHIIANRGLHEWFGVNDTYTYVVLALWVFEPLEGVRQSVALLAAWAHGSMGVHFWLRLKPFYPRLQPYLYGAVLLLPVLSLSGFASARRAVEVLVQDPDWFASVRHAVQWPGPEQAAWAFRVRDASLTGLAALLLLALGAVRLTYPGRRITIVPGMSVLEASRVNGIPHASVCGGRGRCSTCRVRVGEGAAQLAPASADETKVLERIGAPPDIRLACQIRPTAALEVTPLLPPSARAADGFRRPDFLQGSEREVAILFADLRAFTKFSQSKLPYDVVFVLNQYFRVRGGAVESAGGRIDKFIGDSIMALFGVESGPERGCRDALAAARAMGTALDELN